MKTIKLSMVILLLSGIIFQCAKKDNPEPSNSLAPYYTNKGDGYFAYGGIDTMTTECSETTYTSNGKSSTTYSMNGYGKNDNGDVVYLTILFSNGRPKPGKYTLNNNGGWAYFEYDGYRYNMYATDTITVEVSGNKTTASFKNNTFYYTNAASITTKLSGTLNCN